MSDGHTVALHYIQTVRLPLTFVGSLCKCKLLSKATKCRINKDISTKDMTQCIGLDDPGGHGPASSS